MSVFAFGDSVMQGAGPDLYGTLPALIAGIEVDAVPSRQFHHAADVVRSRLASAGPLRAVVVHLGTNGLFSDAHFDDLVATIDTAPEASNAAVIFVNIRAPREWEDEVNLRLARGVERHGQRTKLVDWHSITHAGGEYLKQDGFHVSRLGALVYAETIAASLPGTEVGN